MEKVVPLIQLFKLMEVGVMSDLDLLWQLQKQDDNIIALKEKLDYTERGEKIKEIANNIRKTEFRLRDLKFRMEQTEKGLIKNNSILKDMDYKLKEIEKELYEGNIIDLRQLSYLDKEKDLLREEIDNKEIEILSQMEEMESLKKDFDSIELDFEKFENEYSKLKKEYEELIEKISQIKEENLKNYNQIKKVKENAVVEIMDNKCSGCNVLLPTIILDRLKFQGEIVYCENCGRILYYLQ